MGNSRLVTAGLLAGVIGLPLSGVALASAASQPADAPAAAMSPLATQLAQRGLAAGAGYPGLHSLCSLEAPLVDAGKRHRHSENETAKPRPRSKPSADKRKSLGPHRVFDNLYFVGNGQVSSWALTTSEGIILIDAMNTPNQAETIIAPGMRELGLDPADIRYLVITHGHGDHYGGQSWIVEQYAPEVIMTKIDWDMLDDPEQRIDNPRWGEPPERDHQVIDDERLTLGDTTLGMYITPDHTPGTLSLVFPVKDGDEVHHAVLWGGTGFNFGPDEARLRGYSASASRMHQIAQEAGVDVFLSNHPKRDGTPGRIAALETRKPGEAHPFVTGGQALGALDLLSDCTLAQAERLRGAR